MIDIERRKKLAFHLRQLSVGLTTNDEFEEGIMDDVTKEWLPEQYYRSKKAKEDDAVIVPMLELSWCLYDDTRQHKLVGRDKLPDESLKIIARCILFLHSDLEYEWPDQIFLLNPIFKFSLLKMLFVLVINILTLGWHIRNYRKKEARAFEEFKKLGAFEHWPFFRKADYEMQLQKQPFLKSMNVD
jgi:hypothetical protein